MNFTSLADEDGTIAKRCRVPFGKGAKAKAIDVDGKPIKFERAGTVTRWTFFRRWHGRQSCRHQHQSRPRDRRQKDSGIHHGVRREMKAASGSGYFRIYSTITHAN